MIGKETSWLPVVRAFMQIEAGEAVVVQCGIACSSCLPEGRRNPSTTDIVLISIA